MIDRREEVDSNLEDLRRWSLQNDLWPHRSLQQLRPACYFFHVRLTYTPRETYRRSWSTRCNTATTREQQRSVSVTHTYSRRRHPNVSPRCSTHWFQLLFRTRSRNEMDGAVEFVGVGDEGTVGAVVRGLHISLAGPRIFSFPRAS
jgi:hypothetical protein